MPPGAIPRWCDSPAPPRPEGPSARGGSEGHQRGHGITLPPALPRYSAVTGHAVAPSQPRCAVPDQELRGTAASGNLRSTGRGEPTATPSILRCRDTRHGTSVMAHPSWHIRHGTSVTPAGDRCHPHGSALVACPSVSPQVFVQASRHDHTRLGMAMCPGHSHGSLGMATCPWSCNKHSSGHGGGYESIPEHPPAQPPKSQPCPHLEGSVPGLQPGHRIRASAVTRGAVPGCDVVGQDARAPSPPL